jgi:heterodisulfide reductase subunit B
MKYAYYPGCSLHATAKDYDMSARAVCQALGIELQEIPDWICCGATSAHSTSELLSVALPVQDLLNAQKMGLDTAVCCAACYSRLRIANATMSSPHLASSAELVSAVDQIVGSAYRGEVQVRHLLDIITNEYGLEALQAQIESSPEGLKLEGLKAAAYYGCLLVRPAEAVAFDDPENPRSMDRLIAALGAEAVDWPYKTECCGASLALTRTDIVLKLCRDIYQSATDSGAECLVVACPLCQANLDMRQAQVNKRFKTEYNLPVFYFTQLIGLALGLDSQRRGDLARPGRQGSRATSRAKSRSELGLGMGLVSPSKLLDRFMSDTDRA